jgi:histidinol phosphatase-like PHP family hydrolase
MVVNTDSHEPGDLVDLAFAQRVAAGAGLSESQVRDATLTNPRAIVARLLAARAQGR